jgi:hypothetical protein
MAMIAMRNNAIVGSDLRVFLFALLPHLVSCGCGCAIAVYLIICEVRWGHLPASMSLVGRRLAYTTPGVWGMNERIFDAGDIHSFRIESLRDIFGRKGIFKLIARTKTKGGIRRQFRTRDAELPRRIEERFKERIALALREMPKSES